MRSVIRKQFQQGKRRDMTKLFIGELSSVDRPAQDGAHATIMKRKHAKADDKDDEGIKKVGWVTVVTSTEDGHGHMLEFWPGEDKSGHTDWAIGSGDGDDEHRHAWHIDEEGQIQIVMNAGHLHAVERDAVVNSVVAMVSKGGLDTELLEKIQKNFPETVTTEETNMDEKEVQALQETLKRSNDIVALSATHRAHFDTIEKAADQDSFLAKSLVERETVVAEISKVAEAEAALNSETVYTATDGHVFTKSDSPLIVAAVIRADSLEKKVGALEKRAADGELAKRAEVELGNLPGTPKTRTALLKSVEGIEDEGERAEALKSLHAANEAAAVVLTPLGTSLAPTQVDGSASDELEKLAKTAQQPGETFEKAYSRVCDTPEGGALFMKHREAMNSALKQ